MLSLRFAIGFVLLLQVGACSRMPAKQPDAAFSHSSLGKIEAKGKKNKVVSTLPSEANNHAGGGDATDPYKILKQVQRDKVRWAQEPQTDVAKLPSQIATTSQKSNAPQESGASITVPTKSKHASAEDGSSAEERDSKDEGLVAMQRLLEAGYKETVKSP